MERPQVGVHLLGDVAGQEAELLARLDRRAGEHDPLHLPLHQVGDRHGHGQVGLAGAGRADAEDDVVVADGLDVPLLRQPLGRDDPVARGDEDGVAEDLLERDPLPGQLGGLVHVLQVERVAALHQLVQLAHQRLGQLDPSPRPPPATTIWPPRSPSWTPSRFSISLRCSLWAPQRARTRSLSGNSIRAILGAPLRSRSTLILSAAPGRRPAATHNTCGGRRARGRGGRSLQRRQEDELPPSGRAGRSTRRARGSGAPGAPPAPPPPAPRGWAGTRRAPACRPRAPRGAAPGRTGPGSGGGRRRGPARPPGPAAASARWSTQVASPARTAAMATVETAPRSQPRRRVLPALGVGPHRPGPAGRRQQPQVAAVDQVRQRLAGLELAQPGEVDDPLGGPVRVGERRRPAVRSAPRWRTRRRPPPPRRPPRAAAAASARRWQSMEGMRLRTMGHSSTRRNPSISTDSARSGVAVSLSHSTRARLELVGAALPVEEPVDGLGGLEVGDLPQVLQRDDPVLDQEVAQPAQRAALQVEGLVELRLGDAPRPAPASPPAARWPCARPPRPGPRSPPRGRCGSPRRATRGEAPRSSSAAR